eukprot:gene4845-5092_t
MAASTYACATGSVSDVLRSEEDRRLLQRFRKRKKTIYWDSSVRPLFACQADMRTAGLLKRDKDAVLVLFSDSLAVLCGSALDGARDDRSAERLPALRLIAYSEPPANSAKVTYETTTLVFGSAELAQEAAAALAFYRAQCAAMHRWLSLGLHAGLQCQLATVEALPLSSTAGAGPTLWRACSFAADRSCPTTTGRNSSRSLTASRYAWAIPPGSSMAWGCQVPLPEAWGDLLDKEVATGQTADDGRDADINAEDLNCLVNLTCGPQALLVDVFAALTVKLIRTPKSAGQAAAVRPLDPTAPSNRAVQCEGAGAGRQLAPAPAALGAELAFSPGAGGNRRSAFAAAAALEAPFASRDVQEESPLSCGWSFVLVAGDVLPNPGQFLQLQVAQLSCSNESAELRSQLTFYELTDDQLPCLISQPEPAWLTADIKQRFINAKPTLEESQLVARATHEWRTNCEVDSVLQRPCPGFEARQAVLPVYILGKSPDGHAVWALKGSGVRQVCDAIHRPAPGGVHVTLDHLALHVTLLNEYLVHKVAPHCLPGGGQIQVYDLAGLQLRHVMGEGMDLFTVSGAAGLDLADATAVMFDW